MSTVGLELTSFINPDLTWKTVSKGNRSGKRRTRKPGAKSLTMGMGLADKNARTVEDVTVSESEKVKSRSTCKITLICSYLFQLILCFSISSLAWMF